MSARNVKTKTDGNLITPFISRWNGDRLAQTFMRLLENPTQEQIEIHHRNAEDLCGKKYLANDLFRILFKDVLDNLPPIPPQMTLEQHVKLFSQIIKKCNDFACQWQDEFYASTRSLHV